VSDAEISLDNRRRKYQRDRFGTVDCRICGTQMNVCTVQDYGRNPSCEECADGPHYYAKDPWPMSERQSFTVEEHTRKYRDWLRRGLFPII